MALFYTALCAENGRSLPAAHDASHRREGWRSDADTQLALARKGYRSCAVVRVQYWQRRRGVRRRDQRNRQEVRNAVPPFFHEQEPRKDAAQRMPVHRRLTAWPRWPRAKAWALAGVLVVLVGAVSVARVAMLDAMPDDGQGPRMAQAQAASADAVERALRPAQA
ncbi:MAG: hypothetical protein ACREP7_01170, partial [Lysobacter sp.]